MATLTPRRQAVVDVTNNAIAHNLFYIYSMTRPAPLQAFKAGKQVKTDCSGACLCIYYAAGAPDPSGNNYNGEGNTDSLFANCEHIPYADCQPADMIDVVQGDGTEHVYLVVERTGGDLKVFSNGGPGAARFEMLSAVKDYWYSRGYHFQGLRELAVTPNMPPHWNVLNGRGQRIATTEHPGQWASEHSEVFRKYGQVRFKHIA